MKQALLVEHFDRLSETPEAVPRLRRLILDLAVRGRLVEHDPKDEPASAFLCDREIKVEPGAEPWKLPVGWAWSCYANVGETIGGGTPAKNTSEFWQGPIPWVSPKDMKVDQITDAQDHISELAIEQSAARLIPAGSLLMVVRGMILARSFPVAMSTVPVAINQDMKAIVPFRPDIRRALLLISRGMEPNVLRLVSHSTHGTCKLRTDELFSLPLPIPPLAEQRRIVTKVEELLALCARFEAAQSQRERHRDRLVAASLTRLNRPTDDGSAREHARFHLAHFPRLTTRPDHVAEIRSAILNLAICGRLAPQDSREESAAALIERSRAERARLAVRVGTRLPSSREVSRDDVPFDPPAGWAWARVEDLLLGDSQNGYSKRPDNAVDGIPILRISAGTTRKDGIVAEEQHKYIGGVSPELRRQYGLIPGDLLACRFNGNRNFVGRFSRYTGYLGLDPIYPDKLIRLRLLARFFLPQLIVYFAESSVVRKEIEGYCTTTVGNWGISASNLKEVKLPIPPLAEQRRIVTKVADLLDLCDRLEAHQQTAELENRRLLDALLVESLAPAV